MFISARRELETWRVANAWGHELLLPALAQGTTGPLRLGVLGTRTLTPVPSGKTAMMARMLTTLDSPLYVLDTRRAGSGAQSSWSPREFASQIPALMGATHPYSFQHLPCLAPSLQLLAAGRESSMSWREYAARYRAQIDGAALAVAQAFTEAACARNGLAIFLCAEPDCAHFALLAPAEQDQHYCHRFALTDMLAEQLRADHPGVQVERVCLDLAAYAAAQRISASYQPRCELVR